MITVILKPMTAILRLGKLITVIVFVITVIIK